MVNGEPCGWPSYYMEFGGLSQLMGGLLQVGCEKLRRPFRQKRRASEVKFVVGVVFERRSMIFRCGKNGGGSSGIEEYSDSLKII